MESTVIKFPKQIQVTYIDHMGTDLSVVNAARVSFGKTSKLEEQPHGPARLKENDSKLINYLAKHKHLSPFGHCFASFHVKAPVFVARQLVKHKYLRWNEISRRYVFDESEFFNTEHWRGASEDKKQGSEGVISISKFRQKAYKTAVNSCKAVYNQLLKDGVAPEQARMILPQSAMTEWYWSGSLDALAAMCKLRCASDTQKESREAANQIHAEMAKLYPVSWKALIES